MTAQSFGRGGGNVIDRHSKAAVEFVAWSDHHAHEQVLHQAALGQIEDHPDLEDGASAVAQQRVWAERHGHERRLHDSAIAQLRHDA